MFYFVYADLVMLAKSNDLGKSALDMNQHYLELQLFLRMVEEEPQTAMNMLYKVFPSGARLYSTEISVNHRLHSKDAPVSMPACFNPMTGILLFFTHYL